MIASAGVIPSLLRDQVEAARYQTDSLFNLLEPGAIYERPVSQRHRLIFYVGHLEAFDWNLVCRGALHLASFHPEFDKLFEFGIDPEPGKEPADTPSDWPSFSEVARYRQEIRRQFDNLLADAPEQRVRIAVEHRLMHAETLAYLFHNLPYNLKSAVREQPIASRETAAASMIRIPAGPASLGLDRGEFGWDNEFPRHTVDVPAFSIGKYKVTNGEYLNFVEAGAGAPHFWTQRNGGWFYRGMFELIPLPLDWPVWVTQQEARAYATWAGKSLLTEAQFHRAAEGAPDAAEGAPEVIGPAGNYDFRHWDPVPVTAYPEGDSIHGVSQLVGNGWEWTSTPFGPFDGFEPFDFYIGYSRNFFDNAHHVMKGASPRTAACFLRRSFRNWFRGDYPYVYAGFRLVEN
jgi:formylglycine-generating enzyme required for sulfatase activity